MATKKKNPAAVALGRLGGSTTSDAKADAARANGAKGGRPRKTPDGVTCTRCGFVQRGTWWRFPTCRNVEACKRRAAAGGHR